MRIVPCVRITPLARSAVRLAVPSGQPIIQFKDADLDWDRYRAWLKALDEPYEQWLLRTKAYDPAQREW